MQQTVGPRAGLWSIVGTDDQLPDGSLPTLIEHVGFGDHLGSCTLASVHARYVLYREHLDPAARPAPEPIVDPTAV